MGYLDEIKNIEEEPYNNFTVIMGKPGSGKTTVAGTYPKPMLVITIGNDGGAVVLKHYGDDVDTLNLKSDEVTEPQAKHVGMKLIDTIKELRGNNKYKTIVIDAYSSVEEEILTFISDKKGGKGVTLNERGSIMNFMVKVRDNIIINSKSNIEYIAIVHVKQSNDTDNISGETNTNLIPKMTLNNGNILLERASNVMYCARKTVSENGENVVKFLTYIGPHPYIDTKIRFVDDRKLESGIYIKDGTFDKILSIKNSGVDDNDKVEIVESSNPFEEKQNKEEDF